MWQLYPWLPYVCVCACVFACALTAIIDVSRDVDSRVVVISQTFKWWVLFKVWPYPIFSSLCLVCIQLNKTTKKENKKKGTVGLKHHMIVSILWRISDFTSSSTHLMRWCQCFPFLSTSQLPTKYCTILHVLNDIFPSFHFHSGGVAGNNHCLCPILEIYNTFHAFTNLHQWEP